MTKSAQYAVSAIVQNRPQLSDVAADSQAQEIFASTEQ